MSNPTFDRELSLRGIVGFMVGLVVTMLVVSALMWGMSSWFQRDLAESDPVPSPLAQDNPAGLPPRPHLQTLPTAQLSELRDREDLELHSYAWTDRDAGLIRVPIERAMEAIVENGLPSWKPEEGR